MIFEESLFGEKIKIANISFKDINSTITCFLVKFARNGIKY